MLLGRDQPIGMTAFDLTIRSVHAHAAVHHVLRGEGYVVVANAAEEQVVENDDGTVPCARDVHPVKSLSYQIICRIDLDSI